MAKKKAQEKKNSEKALFVWTELRELHEEKENRTKDKRKGPRKKGGREKKKVPAPTDILRVCPKEKTGQKETEQSGGRQEKKEETRFAVVSSWEREHNLFEKTLGERGRLNANEEGDEKKEGGYDEKPRAEKNNQNVYSHSVQG